YVSQDATLDGSDSLLSDVARTGTLDAGGSYQAQQTVTLPNGLSGTYYILVVVDRQNQVRETGAESNNLASKATQVALAPYADLIVSSVTAPSDLVIGNPAQIDVSWTVANQGTGAGPTGSWVDRIVLSTNSTYGDGDDQLVGDFAHSGAIAPGTSYTRSEHV